MSIKAFPAIATIMITLGLPAGGALGYAYFDLGTVELKDGIAIESGAQIEELEESKQDALGSADRSLWGIFETLLNILRGRVK
ncbi:MAG: hypothetical protein Q8O98_00090 [bacterium]|nr:hypothetical protein [bacterium]